MNDTINILCATDDKYVPYCGIMLTSLFENNKDVKVDVYVIIDRPLSKKNNTNFKKIAQKYKQKIEYLLIDNSMLLKFPTQGMEYWSIAMYYRIFAEELLPSKVDRILYLDCDIIVQGSLNSLWDINMENKAVGVVPDIFTFSKDCYERLQYSQSFGYFNSGVLLMNIDFWRKNNVCQQCLDYLKNNYDRLFANDQDVLNAVLWDDKIQLPITYNFQVQFLRSYFYNNQSTDFRTEIEAAKTNPTVVHYATPIKPWDILYYKLPYQKLWNKYKLKSPWWYLPLVFPNKKRLKYFIKRYVLWPLGISIVKFDYMENK